MKICLVVGNVWATKKEDSLIGKKLMVVKEEFNTSGSLEVAVDVVGAGIGERVLVVSGSAARKMMSEKEVCVDCAIIGIIDSVDIENNCNHF